MISLFIGNEIFLDLGTCGSQKRSCWSSKFFFKIILTSLDLSSLECNYHQQSYKYKLLHKVENIINENIEQKRTYNQFHNILRLFDVLPNFLFTTNEKMRDY